MDARVEQAIHYGCSLIGAPYVWWVGDTILGEDRGPFWAANYAPPQVETIRGQGVCCTGLVNLIRRKFGLPVPGVSTGDPFAGGTGAWEKFLLPHLEPIDPNFKYPPGTLLFRPYQTFSDQGHIAIIIENQQILHSYVNQAEPMLGLHEPGCCVERSWRSSHAWKSAGYYMYTVKPEGWLA